MGNAIDAFRAQREAAEQLQAQLSALSEQLPKLHQQIASLALNEELKVLLRDEQRWLAQTETTIAAVRRWREQEAHAFWWPLMWRWVVVYAFALASVALSGAGPTVFAFVEPELAKNVGEAIAETYKNHGVEAVPLLIEIDTLGRVIDP